MSNRQSGNAILMMALCSSPEGWRKITSHKPGEILAAINELLPRLWKAREEIEAELKLSRKQRNEGMTGRGVPANKATFRVPAISSPNGSDVGHVQVADRATVALPASGPPSREEGGQLDGARKGHMSTASRSRPNSSGAGQYIAAQPGQRSAARPSAALTTSGKAMRDSLERKAVQPIIAGLAFSDGSYAPDYTYNRLLTKREHTRRDAYIADGFLALGIPADRNVRVREYVSQRDLLKIAGSKELAHHVD